jgi:hypothetical protein
VELRFGLPFHPIELLSRFLLPLASCETYVAYKHQHPYECSPAGNVARWQWRTQEFFFFGGGVLLISVGPAESRLVHCSLSRLIVLTPLLVHLQRRSTSDGVRDLY